MRILVLNGSPRPRGNTKQMIDAFKEGAEAVGNQVEVVGVCGKKIAGCMACEYCHTKGKGTCVQNDEMQEILHNSNVYKRNYAPVMRVLERG